MIKNLIIIGMLLMLVSFGTAAFARGGKGGGGGMGDNLGASRNVLKMNQKQSQNQNQNENQNQIINTEKILKTDN